VEGFNIAEMRTLGGTKHAKKEQMKKTQNKEHY
jgi:hypothetical protein